jgi:hypothetical protein
MRHSQRFARVRPAWLLVVLVISSPASAAELYSRDLTCETQSIGRAQEICKSLESTLAWSWFGHAIISPGFRVDVGRVKNVFCDLPITAADTPILVELALLTANASDSRLQLNTGVVSLLAMLGDAVIRKFPDYKAAADGDTQRRDRYLQQSIALEIDASSTSIFNPQHSQYILREGYAR